MTVGFRTTAQIVAVAALAACGGNGDFPSSSQFAAKCAAPRSGIDPFTGNPFPDKRGTLGDEKMWLRSWTNELYLWYREVPNASPDSYEKPIEAIGDIRTLLRSPFFGTAFMRFRQRV
jgi:carboxyl-terminal processing protease